MEDDASIHLFFVNLHSKLTQRDHLKMTYLGALIFLVMILSAICFELNGKKIMSEGTSLRRGGRFCSLAV